MKITYSAHKDLNKLGKSKALPLIHDLIKYEKKQQGYIKWLENRPGYRIKIGQYRVIFEFDDKNDEIIVLKVLTPPPRWQKDTVLMDIDFEMLGSERVVISLADFEEMQDLIAYDHAKKKDEEAFPADVSIAVLNGKNPLKILRKHRQMSQTELSERSGIAQALISDIENGKKSGSVFTLKSLADALDVLVDDLLPP